MKHFTGTITLALSLATLTWIPANAQLGSVLNRAKRKAQQKVESKIENKIEETVNKAVDKAFDGKAPQSTERGNSVTEGVADKKEGSRTAYGIALRDDEYDCGDNRICLETEEPLYFRAFMTPDWSFIQESAWTPEVNGVPQPINNSEAVEKNTLYYLARLEQATKAGNLEDMLGIYYDRSIWLYNEMATRASRMSFFHGIEYDKYKERFAQVITDWKKIVWAGNPEIKLGPKEKKTQFAEWRDERYNSYIFIAKRAAETQGAAREFYLRFAMQFREMLVGWGDFKPSDPKYSELEKAILAVLPQTSADFQKEMPYRSPEEIIAAKKARDDERAKEQAERKQVEAAARAANTKPFPKSNMGDASLLAGCLKAIKAQYPDLDAKRVSIINTSWQIDRDGFGNIVRRRVSAWVDCKGDGGSRMAKCFGFAQDHMGGGRYSATKFFGTGTNRPFYIK